MIEQIYWGKVAVVGPTGTGKSYLTKTADREKTGLINIERKPLPYKGGNFKFEGRPKNWSGFMKNLKDFSENKEIETIIIDSQTEAFNLLNNEMGKSFTGWDVAKNYNKNVFEYFSLLKNIERNTIVLSHDEWIKTDSGAKERRMTVHNKEYEGKVEQQFSIVLYTGTRLKDNKPQYFLKTFDPDTSAKTPEDLFGSPNPLEIPNDAKFIFEALERYYI